jgi:hypothetical protein
MTLIGAYGAVKNLDPSLPSVVLYGDEVRVQFDPAAHRYTVNDVRVNNGAPFTPPSVTRILGMIDKSDALVGWATRCSMERFREMIQSGVAYDTAYLERAGHLIRTAHKAALEKAAGIGHEAHAWIEQYLLYRAGKRNLPDTPMNPQVRSACIAAVVWIQEVKLIPHSVERIMYSRKHQIVGITDIAGALATIGSDLYCCDWKTSRSVDHVNYAFQTAAYSKMHEEMTGQSIRKRMLIRLDKEDSTAYPLELPEETLDADWGAFLGLSAAHKRLREMEAA